jgi:hypothetical protein
MSEWIKIRPDAVKNAMSALPPKAGMAPRQLDVR